MATKMQLQAIITKGNQIINNFQKHSTGRLNLWTTIVQLSHNYVITAEAQKRVGTGITTAIVAHLPFDQFSYDEYIQVLISLQKHWDVPVLCHAFPRRLLNNLRDQYGSRIIRDDIVRRYR